MKQLLTLIILLTIISFSCQKPTEPPVNFVIIMADDLGYGDLSSYGHTIIKTPNIDAIGEAGITFSDYHSNGTVCSPTRAALLTGLYQQRVGIPGVVYTWLRDSAGLSSEVETMAEIFQQNGYQTGLFGKWHLGYKTAFNPINQGFDEFKGFVAGNVDYHSHLDNQQVFDWWEGKTLKEDPGYSTDLITGYGVDFIQRHKNKPFLLYLPYPAPHDPYQGRNDPPIRVKDQENRKVDPDNLPGIYQEMVEVLDEGVGKIIAELEENGLSDHTMVIFTSDNGANRRGSNGNLRGFKADVYEGGHRVPSMIKLPQKIKPRIKSDETILSMDILPTLMNFANIPIGNRQFDGIDLTDLLTNEKPLPERQLFWAFQGKKAIREGKWKFVSKDSIVELFDLSQDLGEENDLSREYPDLVEKLKAQIESWERDVNSAE